MDVDAVLVTGAARRIGAAIARDFAAQGWAVAVHHNASADTARALVDEINGAGGRAVALAADLGDAAATDALIAAAREALGPLTCLVNNASRFVPDDIDSFSAAEWDAHLNPNLRAPAQLTHHFAAQLAEGAAGNVINIADQRVWRLLPDFLSYTVSKAGLWALTRTTAMALAPRIRVNAIGPGPVLPSERQSQATFDASCAATPLGRGTSPAEICAAIRFILSAPAMTGQMIALDGGEHLDWRPNTPDSVQA
ncbi:MAG: SDR family oxidoreductase [Alphaproteobacteria bacterium]